ncbi:MAG: SGNH/GDSL hydrolase family protein [Firmicutes bacterium]|nr:SGNH/GDSL hydrolase family protein [Bacillota bacterium]
MRKRLLVLISVAVFLLTFFTINTLSGPTTRVSATSLQIKTPTEVKRDLTPGIRVMTIGSSVAAGWGDPNGGGYLAIAFHDLSERTGKHYQIVSWAIPGITTVQVAPHYQHWLTFVHPQIVVISWGGLDDAANHTPLTVFANNVHTEIALALAAGAQVDIVTPPVTEQVYLDGPKGLPYQYFQAEIREAQSFQSPDVHIYNVYNQMLDYIQAHHQTLKPYIDNSWHPNLRGHELGGALLFADISAQMPQHIITQSPEHK